MGYFNLLRASYQYEDGYGKIDIRRDEPWVRSSRSAMNHASVSLGVSSIVSMPMNDNIIYVTRAVR